MSGEPRQDDVQIPDGLALLGRAEELCKVLWKRQAAGPVWFVPTMGALHEGHAELIRAAKRGFGKIEDRLTMPAFRDPSAGTVVVSIFVNPTQFGPNEDLDRYPRTLAADLELCRACGADVVFAPPAEEMYPAGFSTTVRVSGPLAEVLEGAHRPGHFDGVATVVLKLLQMVGPCAAVFGEKDFQQVRIVEQMLADLNLSEPESEFGNHLVRVETVREPDGLALSSRNRYLSPQERRTAAELPAALFAARDALEGGAEPEAVERALHERLTAAGFAVDYAVVRDPETLGPPTGDVMRALVAAKLGTTRLIDNVEAVRAA